MLTAPTPMVIIKRAFPGIRDSEALEMANAGRVCTYPEKTTLCHEDTFEEVFYLLLSGQVQVTKIVNESEVRLLKHLQQGDFFGEMALIQNEPRAATVTSTTPVTVLEINKDAFNTLVQKNMVVSLALVRAVSSRLRENDTMAIEDLRIKASELANAYQQLAELEYKRSEFLTTIAHELRTPLTAASGFLQVIRMGAIQGDTLNSAMETVARNVQEIIALVNDILFLQEMDLIIQAGEPTEIGAVVAAAVEQQRNHATRNQVGLNLTIAPKLPRIKADARTLERALVAILDNAIKFSPDGGDVNVDVRRDNRELLIEVRDHGVGIPPEAVPHIFERFFHVDEVGSHLFRGVGLGLSIAKQVIEQHGGKIGVASELGKGSQFTILLKIN